MREKKFVFRRVAILGTLAEHKEATVVAALVKSTPHWRYV